MHRNNWEWAFVVQALHEREMLGSGRRGLGFAAGQEPLASLFSAAGCEVLATDMGADLAAEAGWVKTGQHASSLDNLFRQRVALSPVDMRKIPRDLRGFDFHWSACAFEHLGSLQAGKEFVWNSFDLLAPGGVAVHTTEYNMDRDWGTVGAGNDVIFRRADLEEITKGITDHGGRVEQALEPLGRSRGRLDPPASGGPPRLAHARHRAHPTGPRHAHGRRPGRGRPAAGARSRVRLGFGAGAARGGYDLPRHGVRERCAVRCLRRADGLETASAVARALDRTRGAVIEDSAWSSPAPELVGAPAIPASGTCMRPDWAGMRGYALRGADLGSVLRR